LKSLKHIILLLLLVSLTACTALVKEPVVSVKDLNVVSLDSAGAGMELYLGVTNPNSYEITLKGYSYDLKVMALPLAKGGAREEIRFPANAETDVRIPIRLSYADLLEILKRKPNPDAVPYQLAAGLDVETPVGHLTVPVNRTGTYAIPKQYRPSGILNKLSDIFAR
jgi:LEA14-like dessication related protein